MLFTRTPFLVIHRLLRVMENDRVECDAYNVSVQRMMIVTLRWETIDTDDAPELARAMLDLTSYAPSIKEQRWWVDQNWRKYS